MKLQSIFIFLCLLSGNTFAHPLHLSITNITYESGKVKVIMKTFRDDWETAYFHYHSQPIDFKLPENRSNPWFKAYLSSVFWLAANGPGDLLPLETDSVIIKEETMILEMHADVTGAVNSLYIYDALLIDIYPDQTNLVIFGLRNKETGIKFDVKKVETELSLE